MWNPLGPPDANQTTTWMPEPTRRGSFGILSTCLVTLGLCVWTSLHLNVPEHKKENQQFLRKTIWLFIGLVAPEWVAFTAYAQRIEVAALTRDMELLFGEDRPVGLWSWVSGKTPAWLTEFRSKQRSFIDSLDREWNDTFEAVDRKKWIQDLRERFPGPLPWEGTQKWTTVHSHYAVMGGFAIDTGTVSTPFLPGNRTRLTLTPRGLLCLIILKPYLVSYISKENITDKSKASKFAKTIVCVQALWFIIQCITRMTAHLPICLLELSTFVHALCTIFVYLLWWDKPLDIEVPTVISISDEDDQKLMAAMVMHSKLGTHKRLLPLVSSESHAAPSSFRWALLKVRTLVNRAVLLNIDYDQELASAESEADIELDSFTSNHASLAPVEDDIESSNSITSSGRPSQSTILLRQNHPFLGFSFVHIVHRVTLEKPDSSVHYRPPEWIQYTAIKLQPEDQECLKLARLASSTFGALPHELLSVRARNSPTIMRFAKTNALNAIGFVVGFVLSGALYGGIHLFGWNGSFPNRTQKLMWRISVVSIAGPGLCLLGFVIFAFSAMSCSSLISLAYSRLQILRPLAILFNWNYDSFKPVISFLEKAVAIFTIILLMLILFPLVLAWTLAITASILLYVPVRIYIIVECFITLFYIPDGVFDMLNWANYFPHIR